MSRFVRVLGCAGLAWFSATGPGLAEDPVEDIAILDRIDASRQIAVLRGVDKITARVTDIEVETGQVTTFGTLEIVVRTCYKRPPEETPEVTAFLEITDLPPREEPHRIFTGWMFASSPALSALEHAVYDVWVIDCKAFAPSIPEPADPSA